MASPKNKDNKEKIDENDPRELIKARAILNPLNSKEEMRAWFKVYFGLDFPSGVVYPTSSHGPLDALWEIYRLFKTGESADVSEVVMLASRDSFKCNKKGSLILCKDGFKKIEDIKLGDVVWSGKNWRQVTDWIDDGEKESVKLTLRNGIELETSPIHKHWCLRDGVEQWIQAKDIKESDLVCVNVDTGLNGSFLIKNKEEYDNGYFLGLLVGDGGVSSIDSKTHSHFGLATTDPYILKWYSNYIKSKSNIDIKQSKYDKISYKEIPQYCYQSHSAMIGFINGLFDIGGTFNSKNQIEVAITTKKVIYELQKILIGYGINARVASNKKAYLQKSRTKQNHLIHRLYINGSDFDKLYSIGFKPQAKKISKRVNPKTPDSYDRIPYNQIEFFVDFINKNCVYIKNRKHIKPKIKDQSKDKEHKSITFYKLRKLLKWFNENIERGAYNKKQKEAKKIQERIESILKNKWFGYRKKETNIAHFFDLTVDTDHSYWCNGGISHNTLSAAAIECLVLLHMRFSVAHGAAIKSQSLKAIQYINTFFRKINKYLVYNKWEKVSDSKTRIEWITETGDSVYITVLVATLAGMNSEHVPLLCVPKDSKVRYLNLQKGTVDKTDVKKVYDLYMEGKQVKIASMNMNTGMIEMQPVMKAAKTTSKRITIKMSYSPKCTKKPNQPVEANVGENHPVYVANKGKFCKAKDLKPGDKIIYQSKVYRYKSIKRITTAYKKIGYVTDGIEKYRIRCKICGKADFVGNQQRVTCNNYICSMINRNRVYCATVKEIIKHDKEEEMYDFTVYKNHNFLCDNILVKNCLDEIDLIQDPKVLDEAKMVPCTYGQYYPITVYLSTRKFAGGLMEKTIKNVERTGGKILRWNILDVTEAIPPEVARVDEPKVLRYISKELPLSNISPEEYSKLPEAEKKLYEPFKAYAGIAEHPLLPVMKNMLVDRDQSKRGGLYKTVRAVRNNFKTTPVDMAKAQLLCDAPSSSNLVYGRFSEVANTIEVSDAYEKIFGSKPEVINFDLLVHEIKNLGLPIYGGADWGFTDYTAFSIFTVLPDDTVILLWHEREQGLEIDDIVKKAKEFEIYFGNIVWYPDQNYPSYIKTLKRKTSSKWKKFKKDVASGISALQTKIVDADGKRSFLVLKIPENEIVIDAFLEYKWAIDGKGNIIEGTPYHDKEGVSDTMDSIRYPMQGLFGGKKGKVYGAAGVNTQASNDPNREIMRRKIQELTGQIAVGSELTGAKKKIF